MFLHTVYRMGVLFFFCTILNFLSNPWVFAAAKPRSIESKPVQWEENHTWKNLGNRWEVGLDAMGHPLAIYDLSYNDFENRLFLGVLDPSLHRIDTAITLLKNSEKTSVILSESSETSQVQKAIAALVEFKTQHKNRVSAFAENSILPAGWWKNIPWKSQFRTQSEAPPKKFYLSEIDLHRVAKDSQEFQKQINSIDPQILNHLQFEFTPSVGYSMYWVPLNSATVSLGIGQPKKMIDLRCVECGLWDSVVWTGAVKALELALGQIPNPLLAGFLGTSIREYLSLRLEATRLHEEMLFEMLQESEEDPDSPFSTLTPAERERALHSLILAQNGILQALQLIGKDSLSNWAQQKWTQQKTDSSLEAASSTKELIRHSETFDLLNPRFALTFENSQKKKIYALSRPKSFWHSSPHIAINWENPYEIQEERMRIETTRILTHFLTHFIPTAGIGTLISGAYEWAVVTPMHLSQYWESRLTAHLEARLSKQEPWIKEITLLNEQKLNPFILSLEQAYQLAEKRRFKIYHPEELR